MTRIKNIELISQAGMDMISEPSHPHPASNPHSVTATHTVQPNIPAVAPRANWEAALFPS